MGNILAPELSEIEINSYIGKKVKDECGNETRIKKVILDEWNPNLGYVYVFLCESGYFANMSTFVE